MTDVPDKLFVVIVTYKVPIEEVVANIEPHRQFLMEQADKGIFITSGPREPYVGGIVIAKGESLEFIEKVLHEDPSYKRNYYDYEIYEFKPRYFKP